MTDSLEDYEGKYRDWKTGNWYLYARPAPGTPLWRMRKSVHIEWWNYTSHSLWRDNETLGEQKERLGWVLALPDDDDEFDTGGETWTQHDAHTEM